jgi:energy-converting hydrogenase Eha subunit H
MAENIKIEDIFHIVKRTEIILISFIAVIVLIALYQWYSMNPAVQQEVKKIEENVKQEVKKEEQKAAQVVAQVAQNAGQAVAQGAQNAGQAVAQVAQNAGQAVAQAAAPKQPTA